MTEEMRIHNSDGNILSRDNFVLAFFGKRPFFEMADGASEVFERWLKLVPKNIQQLTVNPRMNDPYPGIWRNLEFSSNIDKEISTEVSIHTTFSERLLKEAQDKVEAEISSWISGLVSGAYGVAPGVFNVTKKSRSLF